MTGASGVPKTKRLTIVRHFSGERIGFEYHTLNGARIPKTKMPHIVSVRHFQRRGRDLNPRSLAGNTLSRRAR
jgi:hypothetical protein